MAGPTPTREEQARMARDLGADSLAYLPLDALARCVNLPEDRLCRACVTGHYPTPAGAKRYQLELLKPAEETNGRPSCRTALPAAVGG
jgi:amidophosphoribosyltransferase